MSESTASKQNPGARRASLSGTACNPEKDFPLETKTANHSTAVPEHSASKRNGERTSGLHEEQSPDRPEMEGHPSISADNTNESSPKNAGDAPARGRRPCPEDLTSPKRDDAVHSAPSGDSDAKSEVEKSDFEQMLEAVNKLNATVDAFSSPERLARYAKFTDDPITKREGFMAVPILPGEDLEEFKELVEDVCTQLQLQGSFERRLGLAAASYVWRLENLDIFDRAQRARAKYGKYFNKHSRYAWRMSRHSIISHWWGDLYREMWLNKEEEEETKINCRKMAEFTRESRQILERLEQMPTGAQQRAPRNAKHQLPADFEIKQIRMDPETIDEDFARMDVESALAELGDLVTPERFVAEVQIRRSLMGGLAAVLKVIAQFKDMKRKLGPAPASLPGVQLIIDKGKHLAWGKSSRWGSVRLVTTKRRK